MATELTPTEKIIRDFLLEEILYDKQLADLGPQDLLLENTSLTTYENAVHVARILRTRTYEAMILVTSAYHMPRALLDFRRLGLNPQPAVSDARQVPVGWLPRSSTLVSANVALHELIGIAQFHVYRALGRF